tara:strand:- start:52 stop:2133 length:2082 start_codon:yes stop_codon:yes gene_type:complete
MSVVSGRNSVFKLIARGVTLDQYSDEKIFLSNNVTGLFDVGELPSDFTRQITLPGTKLNNQFFEHVYDISVDEPYLFKTNEKVIAQFDFDGFYVAQGYMQLENVVVKENKFIDSYTISVFGLLSSFSRDLSSTYLTDLDVLNKYNHTASIDIILETWSGSEANADMVTNSGSFEVGDVVYPIVDSGQGWVYQSATTANNFGLDNVSGVTGGSINVIDFKPMLRTKLVVEAIFSQSQYTYESDFFEEDIFDSQYLLCDNGNKFAQYSGLDMNTEGLIIIQPISGSSVPNTIATAGVSQSLDFENIVYDPSLKMSGSNYTMTQNMGITGTDYSSPVEMEIKLNFLVTGSDAAVSIPELYLYAKESPQSGSFQGPIVSLDFMNTEIRRRLQGKAGTGEEGFELQQKFEINLHRGVTYDFQIFYQYQTGTTGAFVIIGPDGNAESSLKVNKLNYLADYRTMNIPLNMPFATKGITSLSFLQGIQKKYNLQIYPSKTKPRHFIIKQFNDWYKEGNVVSFDRYIDLNKKITVTPANNLGVKNLEFGDTLDLDFLSQNFNRTNNREYSKSYYTDTTNFFSQGELKVETTFSSSPLRYIGGSGAIGTGAGQQGTAFYGYPSTSFNGACFNTPSIVYYHNGTGTYPVAGDRIFLDINMIEPAVLINYIASEGGGGNDLLVMQPASATVLSVGTCSGGGGPTS